jgi:hypothetical protein
MIMLGIDAHKRTHTVVAVDELGDGSQREPPRPPQRRITWSPVTALAPTASPTRSTRWRLPGPHCESRTCPRPTRTSLLASCVCWSTTART